MADFEAAQAKQIMKIAKFVPERKKVLKDWWRHIKMTHQPAGMGAPLAKFGRQQESNNIHTHTPKKQNSPEINPCIYGWMIFNKGS